MTVDGASQAPHRVLRAMSSNGLTVYTSVEWIHPTNGTLRCSCNCPAWIHWRDKSKPRTCKHVKALEDGDFSGVELAEDVATIRTAAEAVEVVPDDIVAPETLRGLDFS